MNRTLSNVLIFTAGAIVGSVVTWKVFKSKYELIEEDIFEEEDDEVEDESDEDSVETKSNFNNKPSLKEAYAERVKQLGYGNAEAEDPDEDEEAEVVYEPYVIAPEFYGELNAYNTFSLNYYADGVLTDDLDNRIEDVESMVPADFAKYFGVYEGDEDSVYVRNDNRQCDYEILRDTRRFVDVFGDDPHPLEDE